MTATSEPAVFGHGYIVFDETYLEYVNRQRQEAIVLRPDVLAVELEAHLRDTCVNHFGFAAIAQSKTARRFGPVTFDDLPEHTQRYLRKNCPNVLPL